MREKAEHAPGRIKGRGALVRSLRGLVLRVHRFGARRATSLDERRWAAHLIAGLSATLSEALDSPAVQASLAASERRADINRKTRAVPVHARLYPSESSQ